MPLRPRARTSMNSGETALRKGVVVLPERAPEVPVPLRSPDAILNFDIPALDGDGEFALVVYPSPRFGDGKHSNRPWLQELPDPVSKMAWHSWVEVHPEAARPFGPSERGYGSDPLSPRRGGGSGVDIPRDQGRHGGLGHGWWARELRPICPRYGGERHGSPPCRRGAALRRSGSPGYPSQLGAHRGPQAPGYHRGILGPTRPGHRSGGVIWQASGRARPAMRRRATGS